MAKITFHCWENGPLTEDGCPTTCMLPDGHNGVHEWTRDDQIRVSFWPVVNGDDPASDSPSNENVADQPI